MSFLPSEPVPPEVFIEDIVPALFAELELREAEERVDLRVGIVLTGDGGGEWTLHFVEGELGIAAGRDADCAVTLVQSVEDWRAALWEGRPALVADVVAQLSEKGPNAVQAPGMPAGRGDPEALHGLADLQGLVEAIVVGGDGPDWRIAVQMGPGSIPEQADATITLGAEQAEAIRRGELHPLEALITGQLQLIGDLGLILQLQAVAMQATMAPPRRGGASEGPGR
jgi:hypothetical protein